MQVYRVLVCLALASVASAKKSKNSEIQPKFAPVAAEGVYALVEKTACIGVKYDVTVPGADNSPVLDPCQEKTHNKTCSGLGFAVPVPGSTLDAVFPVKGKVTFELYTDKKENIRKAKEAIPGYEGGFIEKMGKMAGGVFGGKRGGGNKSKRGGRGQMLQLELPSPPSLLDEERSNDLLDHNSGTNHNHTSSTAEQPLYALSGKNPLAATLWKPDGTRVGYRFRRSVFTYAWNFCVDAVNVKLPEREAKKEETKLPEPQAGVLTPYMPTMVVNAFSKSPKAVCCSIFSKTHGVNCDASYKPPSCGKVGFLHRVTLQPEMASVVLPITGKVNFEWFARTAKEAKDVSGPSLHYNYCNVAKEKKGLFGSS